MGGTKHSWYLIYEKKKKIKEKKPKYFPLKFIVRVIADY